MEQPSNPSRLRIYSSDVRTFVAITVKACDCKILQLIPASMLLGDHVVYLERQ